MAEGLKSSRGRVSGPRSKKGCLTCRSRHTKCDEVKPICGACRKARLQCRQPEVIHSFVLCSRPHESDHDPTQSKKNVAVTRVRTEPATASVTSAGRQSTPGIQEVNYSQDGLALNQILCDATVSIDVQSLVPTKLLTEETQLQTSLIDSETSFLLRTYERDIGVWMDVFDSSSRYQQGLLTLVPTCPLLLYSACALAAQQLSLISCARTWAPVAEKYYGYSLSRLRTLLADPTMRSEHAMVAAILLSSYELLRSPNNHSYHQHFKGTKSLIETLKAYDSKNELMLASFWIYARQAVGEAMNMERPAMLDPKLCPKADLSFEKVPSVDVLCNDALRVSCEVINFIFDSIDTRHGRRWTKEWVGLHSDLEEWLRATPKALHGIEYHDQITRRFWFPRSQFASAICYYHVSKLFLALNSPDSTQAVPIEYRHDPTDEVQSQAKQIIDVALSDLPDGVLVTMVQPLFHAARHVQDLKRRGEAIHRLEDIRMRTGYYTESKVRLLRACP